MLLIRFIDYSNTLVLLHRHLFIAYYFSINVLLSLKQEYNASCILHTFRIRHSTKCLELSERN